MDHILLLWEGTSTVSGPEEAFDKLNYPWGEKGALELCDQQLNRSVSRFKSSALSQSRTGTL